MGAALLWQRVDDGVRRQRGLHQLYARYAARLHTVGVTFRGISWIRGSGASTERKPRLYTGQDVNTRAVHYSGPAVIGVCYALNKPSAWLQTGLAHLMYLYSRQRAENKETRKKEEKNAVTAW